MSTVDKIIASLDLTLVAQRGEEVHGLCPMHKERTGSADHNPSWWINTDTGYHMCFSCGYKGNLYTLVRDLHPEFDHWDIQEFIKTDPTEDPTILMKRIQDLPQYVHASDDEIPMSEARLAVYTVPPDYALERRRISRESARKYGVLWDPQEEHWILPIRDPHLGTLLGWQEKGHLGRFFKNQPVGVKKSHTLFGVDLQDEKLAIVVESPLDCLRLYSAGFTGGVSTFGAALSERQAKLLRYSSKIICAFDNDKAGITASDEMQQYAKAYGLDVSYFNYGESNKKDPGDMTDEEIRFGIEHARTMLMGRRAYAWLS